MLSAVPEEEQESQTQSASLKDEAQQQPTREAKGRCLEEGLETLFRGLLLEAILLLGTGVARLFGLLYLVKHGLELNCGPQRR
jgi:hypothetical protein